MVLVLTFGVVLLVTVALSGLAARSVLSTALVFLVAGALVGPGFLGLIEVSPEGPLVSRLADLALFTVLFVDGGRLSLRELRAGWRLSGRALGLGMPLALVLVAVAAHYLVGLDWTTSLLVGAILSPTDPVFASAIVGRSEVPLRLRRLLNIESGRQRRARAAVRPDLPRAGHRRRDRSRRRSALELVLGVVLGVVLPLVVTALFRLPVLGSEPKLQPLGPLAAGDRALRACATTPTPTPTSPRSPPASRWPPSPREPSEAFEHFGDLVSELTKFAAVLVFGALLTPAFFTGTTLGEWVVALLSLLLIVPRVRTGLAVARGLPRRERYAAAWFGPKGFASVVYGLLAAQSGIAEADRCSSSSPSRSPCRSSPTA